MIRYFWKQSTHTQTNWNFENIKKSWREFGTRTW